MDFVFTFDLTIFAIILLVALRVVILFKQELLTIKGRLFRLIIDFTILMLVLEIFSWLFDGKIGELNRTLNISFNFLFTALNTVIISLWASYIDYMIHEDSVRLKKRWFYIQPTIIVFVLSIINLFTPILFVVSDANVYQRLPLIWISISFAIVLYAYVLRMVIKNKRYLKNNVLYGVMVFLMLPIIATVMQLFYYGLLIIWPTTAVALIFSYLIFETTSSSRDFLTGAYTRMKAEEFIKSSLRHKKPFGVVMVDLDDFKVLNDTFGHHIGDDMLVEMTRTLQTVFDTKAIVSRYGGDEFIIVVEGASTAAMERAREQIKQILKDSDSLYAQEQKFSYGIAICDNFDVWTMESIIIAADNNMYFDKSKNKNYKRRKSDR